MPFGTPAGHQNAGLALPAYLMESDGHADSMRGMMDCISRTRVLSCRVESGLSLLSRWSGRVWVFVRGVGVVTFSYGWVW
jgi:hypothetical protein